MSTHTHKFWFEKCPTEQFLCKRALKRKAARNLKAGKGIIDVKLMEPYFELPWDKHAQFMYKRKAKIEAKKRAKEEATKAKELEDDCSNYFPIENYLPIEPEPAIPPQRAMIAPPSLIDVIIQNMEPLAPIEQDAIYQALVASQGPPLAFVASQAPRS